MTDDEHSGDSRRQRSDAQRKRSDDEPIEEQDAATVDWEALPRHPDLRDDLGYEIVELEVIEAPGSADDVVFLPMDESLLRDDSFIVVGPAGRCDLGGKR